MSIQEARVRFEQANAAFEAVITTKRLTRHPSSLPPPSFFGRVTSSIATLWHRAVGISPDDAERGVKAAHEVIYKLARASGDEHELDEYSRDMVALTNELTAITEKQWAKTEREYKPITDAIKAAADDLKAAKARADKLADTLNIAADLLSGFGKFLTAFK